jgi:hypothetical protein
LLPLLLCLLLQVSPDSGLLQCSTVADVMDFEFAGSEVGNHQGQLQQHLDLTSLIHRAAAAAVRWHPEVSMAAIA